jgi:hypothetical protein
VINEHSTEASKDKSSKDTGNPACVVGLSLQIISCLNPSPAIKYGKHRGYALDLNPFMGQHFK